MSFRTGLTGLNAATNELSVISNNIANNNTIGFKESRAEFGDIFLGNATRRSIGTGVKLNSVTQLFDQGNINTTGNPLDLAVDGGGFFELDDSGSSVYTRAGAFGVDREGYIVNNTGLKLRGFGITASGDLDSSTSAIQLQTEDIQPNATTRIDIGANLDASDTTPAQAFNPDDPDSYNFSTSLAIYDSLGDSHTLNIYFIKDGTTANTWNTKYSVDGAFNQDASGATVTEHVTLAPSNQLAFTQSGLLNTTVSTMPITATIDLDAILREVTGNASVTTGAVSPQSFDLYFSSSTQFGGRYGTNSINQDGFASGRLLGIDVGDDGTLFGRYSNGQSKTMGQVALVNFANEQLLSPVGDTAWIQSFASGEPLRGAPGTASLGFVRSGALESSNVELTEQLVNMITAQRNFQANAQVISAADSLAQTLLQMR